MENVGKIIFPEGFYWVIDVKQSSGEETKERVTISSVDDCEVVGSRGTANLVVKWGGKAASSMSVLVPSRAQKDVKSLQNVTLGEYKEEDNRNWSPIVCFDSRGMEPSKWYPTGPFTVESTEGTPFEGVDLSDPDGWCEYDQAHDLSLTIDSVEFEFRVMR